MNQKFTICRVCGYDYKNYYPWAEDGNSPTYDICRCCGVEFGYEDDMLQGIKEARQKWIDNGMKWYSTFHLPPSDYNPKEQLKNIPPEWL